MSVLHYRYYGICHPLRARYVHTASRAVRLVVAIWVISFAIVSPQLSIQRLEPFVVLEPIATSAAAPSSLRTPPRTTSGDMALLTPTSPTTSLNATSPASSTRPTRTVTIRIVLACTEYFPNRMFNVGYTLFTYVIVYVTPVLVMLVAYVRIAHELRRPCTGRQDDAVGGGHRSSAGFDAVTDEAVSCGTRGQSVDDRWTVRRTTTGSDDSIPMTSVSDRSRRLRDKRIIVKMLVTIVLLFAVSWFPFFTAQVSCLSTAPLWQAKLPFNSELLVIPEIRFSGNFGLPY